MAPCLDTTMLIQSAFTPPLTGVSNKSISATGTRCQKSDSVKDQSQELLQDLARDIAAGKYCGHMSVRIYDTAWLSMVSKPQGGMKTWLFPRSFDFILENQNNNGSWSTPADSELDAVLNTMAALLACITHQDSSTHSKTFENKISSHIKRAESWLCSILPSCRMNTCDQVGFEVLVPMLSRTLHERGITLPCSPGRGQMLRLREHKLESLKVEHLYQGAQVASVHCLEALIGVVDFGRLEPLLRNGSMMGSPSATAAFLINSPNWSAEAENYLRQVYDHGMGRGTGAFPSAFPAEIFECSWVLSTLLEAGLTTKELGEHSVAVIKCFLSDSLTRGNGVVGFSQTMVPDADDTSKSLQVLYSLGDYSHSSNALVRHFQGTTCFKTYTTERNASFSANCNVVKALLYSDETLRHRDQLEHALQFLCESWSTGEVNDKWNTSVEYGQMLLTQALVKFLGSRMCEKFSEQSKQSASVTASQILGATLRTQEDDGSWGSASHEVTAYAVLTLTALATMSQSWKLGAEISAAIERAREFLTADFGHWKPSQIWVEKVTYSSTLLTDAYCLAALHASDPDRASNMPQVEEDKKQKHLTTFVSRLPLFKGVPKNALIMQTALFEGYYHRLRLKQIEEDIFPQSNHGDNKYLDFIPMVWNACNGALRSPLPPALLRDMMEISMLNFQADNYIETFISLRLGHNLADVRKVIDQLCETRLTWANHAPNDLDFSERAAVNGAHTTDQDETLETPLPNRNEALREVETVLGKYVNRVISHHRVRACSSRLQSKLRHELAAYLHAQISSLEDDKRLAETSSHTVSEDIKAGTLPSRPCLSSWCLTTGANHTSCPYSYTYYLCLISATTSESSAPADCFATAPQQYLSDLLVRDLAVKCRMENDYGSYSRDKAEGNFNCFDCAEMQVSDCNDDAETHRGARAKADLLEIIGYGEKAVDLALESLGQAVRAAATAAGAGDDRIMDKLRLFVNVTNLYGQIYVQRDIGLKSR